MAAEGPSLRELLVPSARAWEEMARGRTLEDALQSARAGLAPRAAAAVRDLVATALRRRLRAEYILAQLLRRPADPPAAALLTVSLAQLLARTYGDYVLVDEAVHAAHDSRLAHGAFVNGVLRSFLRRREELEREAAADPARAAGVPPWWLAALERDHGPGAAHILSAQLDPPPLVLRVNRRRTTPQDCLARLALAGIEASRAGEDAVWIHRPVAVDRIPGFAEGEVSVQDAGAQLAARWLGARSGMRVLDACAAPGGKTAHLLERSDCRIDAVELDPERAARIDAGLARLGLTGARTIVGDSRRPAPWWDGVPYDRILLDAPCTASGVVGRHPDILWLRRSSDVAKSATLQSEMLDTLWPLLAPAGRLLYVVCSVFAEEGRLQVESFLRRRPQARLVSLEGAGPAWVQLLPSGNPPRAPGPPPGEGLVLPALHDGFFYALLENS